MTIIGRVKKYFKRPRGNTEYHEDTFTPRLMELGATEFSNPDHRETRVRKDRIAKNLVVKVANLITARSPIFLDENDSEMEDLKEEWEANLYNDLFCDVIQATRTHGYAVVEPKLEPIGGRDWLVLSSRDILQIGLKSNYNIDFYKVLPKIDQVDSISMTGAPVQYTLYPNDIIHHYIGKFFIGETGLSTLEAVWSGIVRYSEIEEAMAMYDARIGRGVITVAVDINVYQNEIPQLKNAIKCMNNRGFLLLKYDDESRPPLITWEGSNSTIDFPKDMRAILEGIASATGFPVRYLIGDPKGAQSAAKEDKHAVYENLKSIFGEYKSFIRKVLLMQEDGEALNDRVKKIEFDDGGNLMEEDEAEGKVDDNEEMDEQEVVE